MMTYPGIAFGAEPHRRDPDYDDSDGIAISETNAARRVLQEAWVREQLDGRTDLIDKSIPDYPAGGKRPLQDDGFWLQSLRKPNVELVRTAIDRIVADGVVTGRRYASPRGRHLLRHGFRHNEFLAPMTVIGRNGITLRDQWGDEPTAYLGVTMPNFPNLFCLYGAGHESRAQRELVLPLRVPDQSCTRGDPPCAHERRA
jgi:4-hydroxyacetophenone monooxygenase